MSKATLPIPSFPDTIDRFRYGDWLAGFTDGEGCFHLGFVTSKRFRPSPQATFVIALRRDDQAVLERIQSYWQVGRLYLSHRTLKNKKHFVTIYSVQTAADLANVVVPHFERHPLASKKAGDFLIWKRAVALLASRSRRGRGPDGKYSLGWTDEEIARFTTLHDALKAHRILKMPSEAK